MSIRGRVLGLLILLLAGTALVPLSVEAAATPLPAATRVVPAVPCALAANNDFADVNALAPSRVDVLANDCVGSATVRRPLTITAVTQGAHGTVTTDGTTVTYDPLACATGTDSFTYTMTDGSLSSGHLVTRTGVAVVSIHRPGTSPVTDAPQVGFVTNTTIGSTVPLKVSWCGATAAGSSVKTYRLEQSTNGGVTFPTVLNAATAGTSTTRSAAPNTSYAWRVATTDSSNRVGGFAGSLTSKVTLIQDSSTAVTYSSGWSSAAGSKYSGGRERYTSKAGATATVTVTNVRAVAIVSSKAPGRGGFNVYVDNVKVTPSAISEKSGITAWRRVLYIRGLTSGAGVTHKVQLRAAGNGRVDLDAFVTLTGRRDQAVTFSTSQPTDALYRGTDYAVAASSTSGLPVMLSIPASSWPVCSLAAGVVSFHGAGTCRVNATQTGDVSWNAGSAFQSFAVAKRAIDVTGITAADRGYDGTTHATLDVSGAALDSADVLSGDVVTLVTTGATGTFTPDGSAGAGKTVTVSGLTLAGANAATYSVTPPTTTATISTIGLTVSFIAPDRPYDGSTGAAISSCSVAGVVAGDTVTCDKSGATASFADAGAGTNKTVTGSGFALAGADAGNYTIDTTNTTTADITKATQTVGFTSTAPSSAQVSDTYDPTATATSGLPVTITVDPSAASVCHITAGQVTMDDAGTCVLDANQAGDANHQAAGQVQQSFGVAVTLQPQTISFDLSGVTAAYGDDPVAISATASSGLAVAFATQTPSVCTVAGGDVTILTTGTCTIRASQAGNATYDAAPDVDEAFTVHPRAITVRAVTDSKPADGTTASDGVPTITSGSLATGDTATWSQVFSSATAGSGKTLTPSGTVAHGVTNVTARYAITFVAVTTGVITPGPADVTTSTVAVMPGSVQNDGVDTANVTVQLKDAFGNNLTASGGTVVVLANHGSVGSVDDNLNGTYSATYTSDLFSGFVIVSATLDGTPITDTASLHQH